MGKAVYFINFSEEDFSWKFNGEKWLFKAGCKEILPNDLADHFSKHFINRELNKRGIPVDRMDERSKLFGRCIKSTDIEEKDPDKLRVAMLNAKDSLEKKAEKVAQEQEEVKEVKKKVKKPNKSVKDVRKAKAKKDEEVFEGLE